MSLIFKRDEAFRYTFVNPIPAIFTMIQVNDREVNSSPGMAKIIDISPEGLRFSTNLRIPDVNANIVLSIIFKLNETELTFNGEIVWTKEMGSIVEYGIHLLADDTEKDMIIEELKIYSKNNN